MTNISTTISGVAHPRTAVPGFRRHLPRNPAVTRIIVIVIAVLLWEILGHTVLDPDFLSPPTTILQAAPRVLGNPGVQKALWDTFYELIAGFGLAVILGIIVAVPIGLHHPTLRSAMPIILLIFSIPQVTILPLFVLYFGTGAGSKIAFGASHGIFPVILNVVAGVQTVSAMHLTVARSLGATRGQILRRVVLPHMVPNLFTGLRLAMSGTLLGVLLAELYVSAGGIGHYSRLFSESFDPPATFSLVAALALMAVFLNEVVRRAERRSSFWREENR